MGLGDEMAGLENLNVPDTYQEGVLEAQPVSFDGHGAFLRTNFELRVAAGELFLHSAVV